MRVELVDDEGDGPAVVYLPGIGGTGAMMLHCAVRLRERFRVLRLRYVGGGPDEYPALAASIDSLLAARGVDRALLLAESFGSGVGLTVALEHPARVAALGIVNGFARHPWRWKIQAGRLVGQVVGGPVYRWFRRRVGVRKLLGPRWDPELAAEIASKHVTFDAAYRGRLKMLIGLDLRARLTEVRAPVTLFVSDQDQLVPAQRCAAEMSAALPDVEVCRIENAGHVVLPLAALPWPDWVARLAARAAWS